VTTLIVKSAMRDMLDDGGGRIAINLTFKKKKEKRKNKTKRKIEIDKPNK
jgi:hypothetical protein